MLKCKINELNSILHSTDTRKYWGSDGGGGANAANTLLSAAFKVVSAVN